MSKAIAPQADVVDVVIGTPVGDWHVKVRGFGRRHVEEAARNWVLRQRPDLRPTQLRVL